MLNETRVSVPRDGDNFNRPDPAEPGPGWADGLGKDGYSRENFYCGGTDPKGHSGKARDLKVQPWLLDLMWRAAEEIPAYKGQLGNLARNAFTHQVKYDIDRIADPKKREALMREFRLHVDMEEQARQMQRYSEMQRYVSSCGVALPVYANSGNWMMVTREVEKMRKNLDEGVIWEPCAGEVRQLIDEYEKKLRTANKTKK